MLRFDLKRAGIRYRDQAGRVFDFHALRGQFVSNLIRAGVPAKTVQVLARHSTASLTLERYARVLQADLWDATRTLPDLDGGEPDAEDAAATRSSRGLAGELAGTRGASRQRLATSGARKVVKTAEPHKLKIRGGPGARPDEHGISGIGRRDPSPVGNARIGEGGIRTPEAGASPPNGFRNRLLQPLGHLSIWFGPLYLDRNGHRLQAIGPLARPVRAGLRSAIGRRAATFSRPLAGRRRSRAAVWRTVRAGPRRPQGGGD